jgi:hypothetical protein
MGQPRYRDTGENSFHADYLYDQIVPKGHFLRQLDAVIPWQEYGRQQLQSRLGLGPRSGHLGAANLDDLGHDGDSDLRWRLRSDAQTDRRMHARQFLFGDAVFGLQ